MSPRSALLVSLCVCAAFSGCGSDVPTAQQLMSGGACPAPTGAGVTHRDNIAADETWHAQDNPHQITSSITVSATLTLEPCVVVQVAEGVSVRVDGTLLAQGTNGGGTLKPVIFRPAVDGTKWAGLFMPSSGKLDLQVVGIGGAGFDNGTTSAAIDLRGTQTKPLQQRLKVQDVAIVDSATRGINMTGYASFSDGSTNLIITGAKSEPVNIEPPAVHTLPVGSYTGNGKDEVRVAPSLRVEVDEGFPARGVPYRVTGTMLMYDTTNFTRLTLTVTAGVTIKFDKDSGGSVGFILGSHSGASPDALTALVVDGTAEKPVRFTSGAIAPFAGDWSGIMMRAGPTTGNKVNYATFEYAGGFTGTRGFDCGPMENNGGLLLIEWRPDDAFVTNSTFTNTLGSGIVSGWTLAPGQAAGPDLTSNNTFSNLSAAPNQGGPCNVSEWASSGNPRCRTTGTTCVGQ